MTAARPGDPSVRDTIAAALADARAEVKTEAHREARGNGCRWHERRCADLTALCLVDCPASEAVPVTAARPGGELREVLAEAARDLLSSVDEWPTGLELADAILPAVTAWVEAQACARAAGELMYAAQVVRIEHGTASTAAKIIDVRAAALTADDRTGPA